MEEGAEEESQRKMREAEEHSGRDTALLALMEEGIHEPRKAGVL